MTNEPRQGDSGNFAPIWGIFLLFIGVIFLLQTLNVFSWSLWDSLWRFWPAIIIIIGICILLRRRSIWLASLLTVIILGACLGIAISQQGGVKPDSSTTTAVYTQPAGNVQQANVNIDFTAGRLDMDDLPADSQYLVRAETETRDNTPSLKAVFGTQGATANLDLTAINQQRWPGRGINWQLFFKPGVKMDIDIKMAAGTGELDCSNLSLARLNIDLNAGSLDLSLPEPSGSVPVNIKANAASAVIRLPADAAARIQGSANVGTLDIDDRFTKRGDDWYTANYDGATNRFELDVQSNVGKVEIK